jgi:hypothetical protein
MRLFALRTAGVLVFVAALMGGISTAADAAQAQWCDPQHAVVHMADQPGLGRA